MRARQGRWRRRVASGALAGAAPVALATVGTLGVLAAACGTPGGGELWRWSPQRLEPGAGETLVDPPETLASEPVCAGAQRPVVRIERDALEPSRAAPGGRLVHVLVYAFCPGSGPLAAPYRRTFSRGGRTLHVSLDPGFAFRPGRWRVEREIRIPEQTPPGEYALAVTLHGDGVDYSRSLRFTIGSERSSASTPK